MGRSWRDEFVRTIIRAGHHGEDRVNTTENPNCIDTSKTLCRQTQEGSALQCQRSSILKGGFAERLQEVMEVGEVKPQICRTVSNFGKDWISVYRLAVPPKFAGIHDVFHVLMLKKYVNDPSHIVDFQELEVQEDMSIENQPVRITDRRDQVLREKVISLVRI